MKQFLVFQLSIEACHSFSTLFPAVPLLGTFLKEMKSAFKRAFSMLYLLQVNSQVLRYGYDLDIHQHTTGERKCVYMLSNMTMEHYCPIRKNQILSSVRKWRQLEIITFSGISQTLENKYPVFSRSVETNTQQTKSGIYVSAIGIARFDYCLHSLPVLSLSAVLFFPFLLFVELFIYWNMQFVIQKGSESK